MAKAAVGLGVMLAAGAANAANFPEVEPNDNKSQANFVTMAPGDTISGATSGNSTTTPGAGSADYFRIQTVAQPLGIYRYRLNFSPTSLTYQLRGLSQTSGNGEPGVINPSSDATLQGSFNDTNAGTRLLQWYGFGKQEEVYLAATALGGNSGAYVGTLTRQAVTPTVVTTSVPEGQITITTSLATGTPFTDMWIYDANFNPIPGFGNNDPVPAITPAATLTRIFTPGTYYVVMSREFLRNDQAAAADENFGSNRADFPNIVLSDNSLNTARTFGVTFTTQLNSVSATQATNSPFDVAFFRFTVAPNVIPTNPTITASFTPNNGSPGEFFAINATVVAGANPSTLGNHVVTADFTSIGGGIVTLNDNGGNLSFTAPAVAIPSAAPGTYTIPVRVTESVAPNRVGTANVQLTVITPNADCFGAIDLASFGPLPSLTTPQSTSVARPSPSPALPGLAIANRVLFYSITPSECGVYTFETCSATTGTTVGDTILSIYSGICGALQQEGIDDDACGSRSRLSVALQSGQTYFLAVSTFNNANVIPGADLYQIRTSFQPAASVIPPTPAPLGTTNEIEPNNSKAQATPVAFVSGNRIAGVSAGDDRFGCDLLSPDYFLLSAPQTPGITRYRVAIETPTGLHGMSLRGLFQSGGEPAVGSDFAIQFSLSGTTPRDFVQWYGLGTGQRDMYLAIAGLGAENIAPYSLLMSTETVTPTTPFASVPAGELTLTTNGQNTPQNTDTGLLVYDSSFNAIAGFVNDDDPADPFNGTSTLTRTFGPGTYYIGVGDYRTGNNIPAPTDDGWQLGELADFANIAFNSSADTSVPVSVRLNWSGGTQFALLNKLTPYEIKWVTLDVTPAQGQPCNNADIANTDGDPGFDGVVDNGDFGLFFQAFFSDPSDPLHLVADIANTDGDPGADGVVDNGDFGLFFQAFFTPCP